MGTRTQAAHQKKKEVFHGERMRQLRQKAGLSMEALAREIYTQRGRSISKETIGNYERKEVISSKADIVSDIVAVLGVKFTDLYY